jgi:hypothetical protein
LQQEHLEASDVMVRTKQQQMILNQLKVVIPAIREYDDTLEQLLEQHQNNC